MTIIRDEKEIELTNRERMEIYFEEKEACRHFVMDMGRYSLNEIIQKDIDESICSEELYEAWNSRDKDKIIDFVTFIMNAFDGVEDYSLEEFLEVFKKHENVISQICKRYNIFHE